jgi:hypothetical protein
MVELRRGIEEVRLSLLMLCFVAAASVASASATIIPDLDLSNLCDKADLIVVGRVMGQERIGTICLGAAEGNMHASLMGARVAVEKVIKGSLKSPSVTFRFSLPYAAIGYRGVSEGLFGAFFLAWDGKAYNVLNPYFPYLPAAPGGPLLEGNCIDKITSQLARVFISGDTSVQSRWTRWEAVRVLETVPTPEASRALRVAAQDKDPLVSVWAISALLSRDDISMLKCVEKLGTMPRDPNVENLTAQLGTAISRLRDKRAIPQLAHLVASSDVNVRRGAAAALRNTQDGAAIRSLAHALYDSDPEVQYQAVMGLAEITGTVGEWAPASDTFLKDRQRYLDHWREWARKRR